MSPDNLLPGIEIVYPPSEENAWMADHLRKRLAAYRISGTVTKQTGVRDLSEVKTPCLIVLCTSETPGNAEVERAVERYKAEGLYEHIIALILSGAPGHRFPYSLLQEKLPDGQLVEREPLAANISAPTRREQLKKLETEKLRIIASILGVAFDDLRNRRKRQRMRIAAAASAALFAAAGVFLLYALSRVRIFSEQNRKLDAQYEEARKAEARAGEQRDAAEQALARTVALQARETLESGDSELSLLLCLEFLPEMAEVTELTHVFHDTLCTLSGQGYVPVTTTAAYAWARYGVPAADLPAFRRKGADHDDFPSSIAAELPDGYSSEKPYIEDLYFENGSAEQGCALYRGYFKNAEGDGVSCMRVHFSGKDGQDYYLREKNGEPLYLEGTAFLPDGTLIGIGEEDRLAYRIRIDSGEVVPFFDAADREEQSVNIGPEDDSGGVRLQHSVTEFRMFDGMDRAFGLSDEGVEVYSLRPLIHTDTLEDISTLRGQKGCNYLFGLKKQTSALCVYSRVPFQYLYVLESGGTGPASGDYYKTDAAALPDGKELLFYMDRFYDLSDGTVRWSFQNGDFGSLTRSPGNISSEGICQLEDRNEYVFWDLAEGREIGRIPHKSSASDIYYGPYDEKSGRYSASALVGEGVVWEYREKDREVPEDLVGQTALAEELLHGRTLTQEERMRYHLE